MGHQDDVFEQAQRLKKRGRSAQHIRTRLLQDGWDIGAVDTALWRIGYRGWRSIFAMQRIRRLAMVLGVVAFGASVFGASWLLQQSGIRAAVQGVTTGITDQPDNTKPKPAERLDAEGLTSSEAGIAFDFPKDWSLSNLTDPSDVDGFLWQVEPERNSIIRAELEQRYNIVDDGRSAQDASQSILSDPLATQLATVTITVTKEPTHEVEASIEEWRRNLEEVRDDLSYTISEPEKLTVNSVEGYTFITTLSAGPLKVSTRDYAFVKGGVRVEATTFPVQSQNEATFRLIIDSLRFLD